MSERKQGRLQSMHKRPPMWRAKNKVVAIERPCITKNLNLAKGCLIYGCEGWGENSANTKKTKKMFFFFKLLV